MALINNIYVFVQKEEFNSNIEVSTHPTEKGIDITDNVKKTPMVLSITGEVVGKKSKAIVKKLEALHTKGKIVQYIGRRVLRKAQITSFSTAYSNQIMGGCEFSMELKEVRIAKSPYKKKKKSSKEKPKKEEKLEIKVSPKTKVGMKQIQTYKTTTTTRKVYHTVKKGETAYSIGEKYKSQGSSMEFIVKNNPDAPKVKGDWRTLQIGTKLWVYNQ